MSGKYQAYPEYKDSGVEWLGQIPSHWTQCGFKRFALIRNGRDHKEVEAPDGNYPVIGSGGGFSHANQYLYDGESVLLGRKGTINKPLYIKGKFWTVDTMFYTEVQKNADARFLYYMALTFPFDYYSTNTALPSMTQGDLANHGVAAPSIEEQHTIAAFLDHETARIDRLIEKQQRLIELLKEKRQAVISHAVTKGLDPNAPMKDSGVEWLGQVPEHWEVTRTKFLLEFVTSGSRGWAEYYSDQGEIFFRIANLTRDTIRPKLESLQHVMPPYGSEGERSKIILGDLLVSITADLGSVCVADSSIAGGYVSQHVALARPNKKVTSQDWLGYTILSTPSKEQLLGSGYGGTKVQLSLEDVRELWVVVPPQKEQLVISEYLESKLSRFKALMDRTSAQIDLLKERRTALISGAVTGKIDVRNWQPDTSPQAIEPDLPMAAEQAGRYHV